MYICRAYIFSCEICTHRYGGRSWWAGGGNGKFDKNVVYIVYIVSYWIPCQQFFQARLDEDYGVALQKRRYSAKETYNLIDPTDRSYLEIRIGLWDGFS